MILLDIPVPTWRDIVDILFSIAIPLPMTVRFSLPADG